MRRGRQFGVGADQASARRLDRIVARIANHRRSQARQAHLRKQPIDRRLLREVRPDVQQLRMVDAVAPADRQRRADAPRHRRAAAAAIEIEARPERLLDAAADREVGVGPENAPLAVSEPREIFVEAISAFVCHLRGIGRRRGADAFRPEADAREQIERSVLAEQVAAAHLEEPARRELELLDGVAGLRRSHQPLAPFEPAAVADRRHRRFLDRDDDVAAVLLAGKLEIRDVDAAEQPERRDARARLVFLLLRERLPALELHFAQNRFARRALVADDQHVVDQNLRPLVDGEAELDLRSVADGFRRGLHCHFGVAAVEIQQRDAVGVARKSAARNTAGPAPM